MPNNANELRIFLESFLLFIFYLFIQLSSRKLPAQIDFFLIFFIPLMVRMQGKKKHMYKIIVFFVF